VRGDDDVADVIVIRTLGAELKRQSRSRRSLARRRPPRAEPEDQADPVTVTRVTVIRGLALQDGTAARDWLARCADPELAAAEVDEALALVNRAIHAHRVSAADPYVGDVSLRLARRVRVGYGVGDELVDGRWRDAYTLPPQVARGRRRRMLAPDEQLAAILCGRRPTYPSEDMLLRARLDLDQGRTRAATLQANAAYRALEAEQDGVDAAAPADQAGRDRGDTVGRLATAALERDLDHDETASLRQVVTEMERLARRRRHAVAGS
jgi:hypothetical protein